MNNSLIELCVVVAIAAEFSGTSEIVFWQLSTNVGSINRGCCPRRLIIIFTCKCTRINAWKFEMSTTTWTVLRLYSVLTLNFPETILPDSLSTTSQFSAFSCCSEYSESYLSHKAYSTIPYEQMYSNFHTPRTSPFF